MKQNFKSKVPPFLAFGDGADAVKAVNNFKKNKARGFGKDSKQSDTNDSEDNNNQESEPEPPKSKSFSNRDSSEKQKTAAPEQPPSVSLADGMVQLSAEQLQQIIKQASTKQAEKDKAILDAAQKQLQELEEKAFQIEQDKIDREREHQAALDKQKKETANLFRAFSDMGVDLLPNGEILAGSTVDIGGGSSIVGIGNKPQYTNTRINHTAQDSFLKMKRILSCDTAVKTLAHPYTGQLISVFDPSQIDKFVRSNFNLCMDGLESEFKKLGFLQGKNIDAPTTKNNIPPMYLEMLSSMVRTTQLSQFVMHQFADFIPAMGYNIGDTVQIPRSDFAATSTDPDDWLLDPAVALSNDNQPIMMGHVKAVLHEYGMGKASTNLLPIAVPQFIMATSIQQLIGVVQANLGRNYREFEDLKLRRLWAGTSLVRYNTDGAVSDTAPVANEGGALTREYLIQLAAYLQSELKAPAFDDGKYALVTNPKSLASLINSIDENSRWSTVAQLDELTNLFSMATSNDLGRISGYQFTVSGFHVFSQNSFGVGVTGSEGVTTAGAFDFRTSYAVGRNTIGRATAMPFSIQRSNNDDFQRMNRYVWNSIEAFAQLDVDPGQADPAAANQQARVVEVRTTDVTV